MDDETTTALDSKHRFFQARALEVKVARAKEVSFTADIFSDMGRFTKFCSSSCSSSFVYQFNLHMIETLCDFWKDLRAAKQQAGVWWLQCQTFDICSLSWASFPGG